MQTHLDQNWVKLSSLVWEIWCGRLPWPCHLDFLHFDVISMSQAQVHTWPNFGAVGSNNREDIVFTLFSWALPAVTLTFDLLTPISNQHVYAPKSICDQNWVKFLALLSEILCSQGFRDIACYDLDPWPLT